MQVFDVEKCFDALWLQECINDVFDAGLQNDKLPLLFLENCNAKVAVKSSRGISKRKDIKNIIMQGSVWGSLLCTTSMDKLGQKFYENPNLLYWYKGAVAVPPLCMVDDILAVQTCSEATVQVNAVINSFIELKKLTLSAKKCSKIHVGKQSICCPVVKVHDNPMKNSDKEKYLGDQLHKTAKIKVTIEDRVAKGHGIVNEIVAILSDIPLGVYRVEIGLQLRQAMFLNGVLFNSEAWHNVADKDIELLEKVDEGLLRAILLCHAKVPLEFLFLETGSLSVRYILSSRRMNYLRTLLKREDDELTKRILREQQNNPTAGDFTEMIKDDFKMCSIAYKEQDIISSHEEKYKKS